jgi:hypothetical protein
MSFRRFVYYCAVAGGWAALVAALLGEPLLRLLGPGVVSTFLIGGLAGALIGGALQLVAGQTNPQWRRQLRRVPPGLIAGAVGGAAGGLLGELLFATIGLPRALGWTAMGLGIGSAEGLYEASRRKLRNGLIGGGLGGLIGGVLFDFVVSATASQSGLSGRAAALVVLGVAIGAMIGLAQVVLKEAWLTVVDGFGAGRQLILSGEKTVLGRGDHLPLPLLGYAGRDLESEHAVITRKPDGRFFLADNGSRLGTLLNGHRLTAAQLLHDGDLIRLGSNILRFQIQKGHGGEGAEGPEATAISGPGEIMAPPPPPGGAAPAPSATPQSQPPAEFPAPPAAPNQPAPNQPAPEPESPTGSPGPQPPRPGVAPNDVPRPASAPPRPPGASPKIPPPPPPPLK